MQGLWDNRPSPMSLLQRGFAADGMGLDVKLHGNNLEPPMSALGQKADIAPCLADVRFTPKSGH